MKSSRELKAEIRQSVWAAMEERGVSRPPKPIVERIPNFVGAEAACDKASRLPEFLRSSVIKINPDSPQTHARFLALSMGRILIMPTPRLREGFLLLDPRKIPRDKLREASTIRGSFTWGSKIRLRDVPKVDLVVVGSVAVNMRGARVGKGGGYADLEYGILRELGVVDESTPVITTVHDIQVLETEIPMEEHDISVDVIATPSKIMRITRIYEKPRGIYWDKLDRRTYREIPVLRELRDLVESRRSF